MVHIVASPNWYKAGPRFDSVAITFEETIRRRGAAPVTKTSTRYAQLSAIFYTDGDGDGEYRALVRYFDETPTPHAGYNVCIYELYTLANEYHIIDLETINDHAQMIPNHDRPGVYFRDNTVIRDMFE
jgi:hypothetical protein